MKQLRYLALISLFALPHLASSMSPPRRPVPYTWATIANHTGKPIRISYFRPDPGFYGMHVLVQDTQTIADGSSARIMVTREPITAPRCVYQYPNEQDEYQRFHTDSIEIPLSLLADTQTIVLDDRKDT